MAGPRKPFSHRQEVANQANSKLSTGPRTPEGKAISSRNALKHGLYCFEYTLSVEEEEDMNLLRDSYFDYFNPRNPCEARIVDQMVAASWRVHHAHTAHLHALQMKLRDPNLLPPGMNAAHPGCYIGEAYRKLDHSFLALTTRQIAAFTREHSRLLNDLMLMRRFAAENSAQLPGPVPVPVEPEQPQPDSAPSEPVPNVAASAAKSAAQWPVRNEAIPNNGHFLAINTECGGEFDTSPPWKTKTAAA